MEDYDPNKRYLGPQGHWLNKYIPEYPANAPDELKEQWNKAAYDHDVAFHGSEYAGIFGWVKKWINRAEVHRELVRANTVFRNDLILGVERTKHLMSVNDRVIAFAYADVVYQAVNNFGWAFYKTGGK